MELPDLPVELIPQYALNLNLGQINNLCLTSKQFNELICENQHFWKMKFTHDYKFTPEYSGSWKRLYQNYNCLWSFGENRFGQLGLGDQQERLTPTLIPQPGSSTGSREPSSARVPFKVKAVSVGQLHTVLIDLDNNVWAFGKNNDGQLGLGDERDRSTPTLIPGAKAKAVSAGGRHTVLIDLDDNVWAFGLNASGQLGLGDKENRLTPTQILKTERSMGSLEPSSSFKAKAVSAGEYHTILIDLENNVWSVGSNNHGQVELGDWQRRSTPAQIPQLKAKAVSAKGFHNVLIDLEDNVWAFGQNYHGQLGLGDRQNRSTPTLIPGAKAKAVSAGEGHTVLIDLEDNVWAFGKNVYGELGLGDERDRSTPTQIPQLKAKAVSVGGGHTILIDLEDNVWTFGWNYYGQLGLGDERDRSSPTLIPQLKAKAVSAGKYHTIMIATLITS